MILLRDLPPRVASLCVRDQGFEAQDVNCDGLPWKETLDRPPPDPVEVEVCRLWMTRCARPSAYVLRQRDSYALKNMIEAREGRYVSNGAVIAAALALGYQVRRARPRSVNAHFNLTTEVP